MGKSFTIMRVRGIAIKTNYLMLLLALLITLSLANTFYPVILPGWSRGLHFLAASISCAGLYTCSLLHGLAHTFLASKRGIIVESIELNLLGGEARLKEEPHHPLDDFLILIAGPVVNVLLGGFFFLITIVFASSNLFVAALTLHLAIFNLSIGFLQLLPVYPLDGAGIFRAVFWGFTKNKIKATSWISTSTRLFGWGLLCSGLFLIAGAAFFQGLLFILTARFLWVSASIYNNKSTIVSGSNTKYSYLENGYGNSSEKR